MSFMLFKRGLKIWQAILLQLSLSLPLLGVFFLFGIYLDETIHLILFTILMIAYLVLSSYLVWLSANKAKTSVGKFATRTWAVVYALFLSRVIYMTITTI